MSSPRTIQSTDRSVLWSRFSLFPFLLAVVVVAGCGGPPAPPATRAAESAQSATRAAAETEATAWWATENVARDAAARASDIKAAWATARSTNADALKKTWIREVVGSEVLENRQTSTGLNLSWSEREARDWAASLRGMWDPKRHPGHAANAKVEAAALDKWAAALAADPERAERIRRARSQREESEATVAWFEWLRTEDALAAAVGATTLPKGSPLAAAIRALQVSSGGGRMSGASATAIFMSRLAAEASARALRASAEESTAWQSGADEAVAAEAIWKKAVAAYENRKRSTPEDPEQGWNDWIAARDTAWAASPPVLTAWRSAAELGPKVLFEALKTSRVAAIEARAAATEAASFGPETKEAEAAAARGEAAAKRADAALRKAKAAARWADSTAKERAEIWSRIANARRGGSDAAAELAGAVRKLASVRAAVAERESGQAASGASSERSGSGR